MLIYFDDLKTGDEFTNSQGNKTTVRALSPNRVWLIETDAGYDVSRLDFNDRVDRNMYTNFQAARRYLIDELTDEMPLILSQKEHQKLAALNHPFVKLLPWRPHAEAYFIDRTFTENLKKYHSQYKPIRFNQLILPNNKNHEKKETINSEPRATGQGNVIISNPRRQTATGSRQIGNIQTTKCQRKRISQSQIRGSILSI